MKCFRINFTPTLLLILLFAAPFLGAAGAINPLQAAAIAQPTNGTEPRVSVLIELQEPPVTQIYAERQQSAVNAAQANRAAQVAAATRAQLAAIEQTQQQLLSALQALDVQVLYRNQRVYNGIAVRVSADKLAQLGQLRDVKAVHPLTLKHPTATQGAPLSGTPVLWQGSNGAGITGTKRKIAIIDTGIDYLHTDFGGPGTGYNNNNPTQIGDVAGFPSPKVIGGYDFAGDQYDADPDDLRYQPIPAPDADPIDCYAHGTHVAGIAAGYGVNADGTTYRGAYNAATNFSALRIPPGVAPDAQLYALKVFGCSGGSEIVDQAIEWAVDPNGDGDLSDHVDVINLSLGSPYGATDDPTAIASANAVAAGVIVVASAGNSSDVTYVTGSPAVADPVISVAAGQMLSNQFEGIANFSARGPRRFDSALKPDLTAPGYRIISAGAGSGNVGVSNSGTSMAAPHVAGGMTLLRQLHPEWRVEDLKALAMNSAMTQIRLTEIVTAPVYSPMRIGAGQLDLEKAQQTSVIAYNADNPGLVSVSFGAPEVLTRATLLKTVRVANKGNQAAAYTLTYAGVTDAPGVTFTLPTQAITVAAGSLSTVPVLLTADAAQMQHLRDATQAASQGGQPRQWLNEKSGYLLFWPAAGLFTTTLDGANVNPVVFTNLYGAATLHYAPQTHVLSYTLQINGQSSADTALDITGITLNRGPVGVNSATAYTLYAASAGVSQTVPITGDIQLQPSDEPLLRNGELYVNVTTLTQPTGVLRGQLSATEPVLAVPLYAAPRPAAALHARQNLLDFGNQLQTPQTIALQGVGLNGADTPTEVVSLVSAVELQWSSPDTPPTNLMTDTEGSRVDLYDHADLKYVGVTSDFAATRNVANPNGLVEQSTIYFGLATYGNWSTPKEVKFEIYLDTDRDGVADYLLFNADPLGYNNDDATSDAFMTVLKNLHTSAITLQAFLNGASATTLDTAPFNTNVMLLPVRAAMLGLTNGQASFDYDVQSYSNDRPRIGDGARRYVDRSPRLHYDLTRSGLDLTGGQSGAPLYPDLDGGNIPVGFNLAGYLASNTQGILLLHYHNLIGLRDEVVSIQYQWPATLHLPLIGKH